MGHYDNSYEEEAERESKKARSIAEDQFNKALNAFKKKASVEDIEQMDAVMTNWTHIKKTLRLVRWLGSSSGGY